MIISSHGVFQEYSDFSIRSINSLWPSDAIGRQISLSTLVQVMACCLTAPSHYLNQCWLIISKAQRHSSEGNFTIDTSAINHRNYLENYLSKISFKSPRGQWINPLWLGGTLQHHRTWSSMIQLMCCCSFCTKPLPEVMTMIYHWWSPTHPN